MHHFLSLYPIKGAFIEIGGLVNSRFLGGAGFTSAISSLWSKYYPSFKA
jgi:hypothetical protein